MDIEKALEVVFKTEEALNEQLSELTRELKKKLVEITYGCSSGDKSKRRTGYLRELKCVAVSGVVSIVAQLDDTLVEWHGSKYKDYSQCNFGTDTNDYVVDTIRIIE